MLPAAAVTAISRRPISAFCIWLWKALSITHGVTKLITNSDSPFDTDELI